MRALVGERLRTYLIVHLHVFSRTIQVPIELLPLKQMQGGPRFEDSLRRFSEKDRHVPLWLVGEHEHVVGSDCPLGQALPAKDLANEKLLEWVIEIPREEEGVDHL